MTLIGYLIMSIICGIFYVLFYNYLNKDRQMMCILSQEEFDELQLKKKQITDDAEKILQDLCTRVADSEILTTGNSKGTPWGCIKSLHHEWYCDECPVQDVCPNPYKEWSQ